MGRSFVAQAALRREGSQFKETGLCLRAFVIMDTGSSAFVPYSTYVVTNEVYGADRNLGPVSRFRAA
jgi:hypothetical protein